MENSNWIMMHQYGEESKKKHCVVDLTELCFVLIIFSSFAVLCSHFCAKPGLVNKSNNSITISVSRFKGAGRTEKSWKKAILKSNWKLDVEAFGVRIKTHCSFLNR